VLVVDIGRRFGPEPRPGELGELARRFDGLLDRLAASLRHEPRLSAELSHELRTPLARIVAEVELLQRRERAPEDRRDAYAVIDRSAADGPDPRDAEAATSRSTRRRAARTSAWNCRRERLSSPVPGRRSPRA
jgi:signal transduction histidine kinase